MARPRRSLGLVNYQKLAGLQEEEREDGGVPADALHKHGHLSVSTSDDGGLEGKQHWIEAQNTVP